MCCCRDMVSMVTTLRPPTLWTSCRLPVRRKSCITKPPKMGSSDGRFGDDDDGGDDRTHITQHPSKSELTPTNNDDDDDDYERKTGGSAMAGIWRCSPRWTRSSREYIFPIFRILSVCWWRCWLAGSLADCSANHRVQEECDAKSRKIYYRLPFGQPTQQQRHNKPRTDGKVGKVLKGILLSSFFVVVGSCFPAAGMKQIKASWVVLFSS